MMAQQVRTDVLANNLANVNTVGFKRETIVQSAFPEMLLRRVFDPVDLNGSVGSFYGGEGHDPRPLIGRLGTGTYIEGTWTVHENGSLQWTDNPLDLALEGPGFFVIETDAGLRLTRDGRFTLLEDGTLVTRTGWPVLGEDGPVVIVGQDVAIAEDGGVHVDGEVVDTLQVVDVADPQTLSKQGEGMWAPTDDTGDLQASTARLQSGYVEQANVSAVKSMVELISAFRAYEASQKVIQAYDETLGKVVNELGRA